MIPLRCHTHYSLQSSATKAMAYAKRAVLAGYPCVGFTDLGSVSGMVEGFAAVKDACKHCGNPRSTHDPAGKLLVKNETCPGYEKSKLTAVAGMDLNIPGREATDKVKDNDPTGRLTLLSPDRAGWDQLIRIVSESNRPDRFTSKPRLDLETTATLAAGRILVLDGYPGSCLANLLFQDPRAAYMSVTADQCRGLLRDDWLQVGVEWVGSLGEKFQLPNVRVAVSVNEAWPVTRVLAECLREIARRADVPTVASPDTYYPDPQDASDQRILLAGKFKCSLEKAAVAAEKVDPADALGMRQFFRTNRFHLPLPSEASGYLPEEIEASRELSRRFEAYSLENPPQLPEFPCPGGKPSHEYLTELCRAGWQKLFGAKRLSVAQTKIYGDRVRYETGVLNGAGLAPYFLILEDCISWAVSQGMLVGPGRGSGAGSLVNYLLGITRVDPVEHKLLFERFYDDSRNVPGKVSLPDIDTDFPKSGRPKVFGYLQQKWGEDKVAQIATYGPLKARAALTAVLKARGQLGDEEIKEISKKLPQGESGISDELQEMAEEEGSFSVIRWALENEPKKFAEFVTLQDDGSLTGPFSYDFAAAMRVEGVNKSLGKHPAGVVISTRPIGEICPIVYDKKTKTPVSAFNMVASEKVGLVKYDILGLASLDRIQTAQHILRTRRSTPVPEPEDDEDADSDLE